MHRSQFADHVPQFVIGINTAICDVLNARTAARAGNSCSVSRRHQVNAYIVQSYLEPLSNIRPKKLLKQQLMDFESESTKHEFVNLNNL